MKRFNEEKAAKIIKQLVLALNYMHLQNIMHRDLKPENLLCEKREDGQVVIKLTDFGFATHYNEDNPNTLSLGSPLYMAPELCRSKPYDSKVDVWAVGVITYVLLSGQTPFTGTTKKEIYTKVVKTEADLSRVRGSASAKTFIQACLKKAAAERPTAAELLEHAWLKDVVQMNLSEEQKLNLSSNLASFRKSTAFQAGVCSIIANLQTKAEDLSELREMFTRLDTNNDGFLS